VRNPRYATAVGLLLLGVQQQRQHNLAHAQLGSLAGLIDRMKSWFKGNF
jgi:cell division protein FtsA